MTTSGLIRVLIVDDHPVAQAAMSHLLSALPGFELAGIASGGEEAITLYRRFRPDLVLMDVHMPGMDGIAATERLMAIDSSARVLILTSMGGSDAEERAMRAGAAGYLLKMAPVAELAEAMLNLAHAGGPLSGERAAAAESVAGASLTERERAVVGMMAEGQTNSQIAEGLGESGAAVKLHISTIFAKLGVATRAEAVALAYKRRLL